MKTKHLRPENGMTNYMPLPRSLLDERLPSTALVIYAMLLDRGTISQKNNYTDLGGWVYVVYPIRELAETLRMGDTAVKNNLNLLEERGLIRKTRRSRKESNRIFLNLPEDSWTATGTVGKVTADGQKTGCRRGGNVSPSNLKKQQDINDLYQHEEGESL